MKNHFLLPYVGNKRKEVQNIYDEIKDNLVNITTIVEPFCGSSAFSYYISTLHPKKFKYILNDNNWLLIELYRVASDDDKLQQLIFKLNEFSKYIDNDKARYIEITKIDELPNWFFKNKIYSIRAGLFPVNNNLFKKDFNNLKNAPIISFLKNENITFLNTDGIEIIKQYKDDDNALVFLDPPYLASCNDYYYEKNTNVYEYLYNNSISSINSYMVLCLEDVWIIRMLFNGFIKSNYEKKYEMSKKKTNHIIISNK